MESVYEDKKKKKKPRPVAWIDWQGCSGCGVCVAFCPVNCMHFADSPQSITTGHAQIVKVMYSNCTGCTICEKVCPWDSIEMVQKETLAKLEQYY
jgi:Pyruvate/2-oxoacid:ferredoxin oxidoreductase delta subunit